MPIPNHYSASLSELDLRMVKAVPPGGNWRDIPDSIPSKRLDQIRVSCAAGLGSRSTYYGRLEPNKPSYTITTYFNRPGNGCHIHPDFDGGQHRLISQREAARLQSFPDSFVFHGSKGAVNKQIGNAVPPLLAYQLAKSLGPVGAYVDLFCGAGGMSLGFLWAGWKPLIGAEIDATFLKTYRENVHTNATKADLSSRDDLNLVVSEVRKNRSPNQPLLVLGGPPCQGFSTAGNRRSMEDIRNQLFKSYASVLKSLKPDGFLFENVPGLLSMEGGQVFSMVKKTLASAGFDVAVWDLHAHHFGIPQRRRRIFLHGVRKGQQSRPPIPSTPPRVPMFDGVGMDFVTVQQAIGDLPALKPGEDGSDKQYVTDAQNPYQLFARELISPDALLTRLTTNNK